MKKQDNSTNSVKQNADVRQRSRNKVYRIALCGCLLGFALLLGYVEFLIPFSFGIPGVKLGLANMAVVLCLFCFGPKEAVVVCIGRILLAAFLFGNSYSLLYSFCGGILSYVAMLILYKMKAFSIPVISMAGGITHNLAQICIAYFVVKQGVVFYYVPFLILFGFMTGLFNGFLAKIILARLSGMKSLGEE